MIWEMGIAASALKMGKVRQVAWEPGLCLGCPGVPGAWHTARAQGMLVEKMKEAQSTEVPRPSSHDRKVAQRGIDPG